MIKTARKGKWFEIFIPKNWDGLTVNDIFRNKWETPKKLTHHFRMDEKVFVNGEKANWKKPLEAGMKLQLELFDEEKINVIPSYHELNILYEDDHLIVFNKPPFMSTHPNDLLNETDTLTNAAVFYLQSKGEWMNIRQVHRLDKDTSGAILFAKNGLVGAILDRMLEKREIKRTYIAMVHGLLQKKKGTIHEPIGRDRHHATRRRVSKSGQDAITHYQVIKEDRGKHISYIKCWLDTGRTHQIRVHFSHIGHPLVGDILYGGKPLVNRQALHAVNLEFIHPFTAEPILCCAPFLDIPAIFKGIDIFLQ